MDKYYETLNEYYKELNSGKKCKHCKNEKIFKEEKGSLSFSCGGKKDKCSKGFKIKLSSFIEYNDTLHNFQNFLKRDNTNENKDIEKELKEILELGRKQLTENNNLKLKKKLINEYNDIKIKTKIEQTKLLNDIYDKDYNGNVDKDELTKRYFTLNKVLNEKYKDIVEQYEIPQNNYVMINKGKVL